MVLEGERFLTLTLTFPMTAFRDSTVVVIETGRTLIRAGWGLHDLLKTPSIVRQYRHSFTPTLLQ